MEGWKNLLIRNEKIEKHALQRLEICINCPFNDSKGTLTMSSRCTECGCWLEAKARNLESKCPIDKWQSIDKEMEL